MKVNLSEQEIRDRVLNFFENKKKQVNESVFPTTDENTPNEEIRKIIMSLRSNMFEMPNGEPLYIGYNVETNQLYCGGATNTGIIPEHSVEYDKTRSVDYNLEGLYETALESGQYYDEMEESRKRMLKQVKQLVKENTQKMLSEGRFSYKGFKISNISKDPSFPVYGIYSPEGECIDSTLFPSELKEIVDNYLAKKGTKEMPMESISEEDMRSTIKEALTAMIGEARKNPSDKVQGALDYLESLKDDPEEQKKFAKAFQKSFKKKADK